MPLQPVTFKSFKGLITNVNYLDNTKISGNILYDCNNIQFSVDGVISSRHGHQEYIVPTPTQSATNYQYPWYSLEFPYYNSGDTTAYIITKGTAILPAMKVYTAPTLTNQAVMYTGSVTSGIVGSNSSTGNLQPTYNSVYNEYIRWANHENKWYFNAANGLFVENFVCSSDSVSGMFSRYTLPTIRSFDVTSGTSYVAESESWFAYGSGCRFKAMIVEYNSASSELSYINGLPTGFKEIFNVLDTTTVSFSATCNVVNKRNLNNLYIRVYRTKTYAFDEIAPEDYYLCYESELTKGSYASGIVTFSNVKLPLADSSLMEDLYTDLTKYGADSFPIQPPVCRDFLIYKGYGIYAGCTRQPWVEMRVTTLPANTSDSLTIQTASTTTINAVKIANSTSIPSPTTGYPADSDALTYRGSNDPASPVSICIRGYDPGALPVSTNTYCVEAYAKITGNIILTPATSNSPVTTLTTNPSRTVKMLISGGLFDTSKFTAPGILAIVKSSPYSTNHGKILDVITYQDFEKVSQSGTNGSAYVEFYECTSASGWGITNDPSTSPSVDPGSPYSTSPLYSGESYIFYLEGSSINSLPIYPIGNNVTTNYWTGYSLKPVLEKGPSTASGDKTIRTRKNIPIGTISKLKWDSTTDMLQAQVQYLGPLYKQPGKLFEETTRALSASINLAGNGDIQSIPVDNTDTLRLLGTNVGLDSSNNYSNYLKLLRSGTWTFDLNVPTGATASDFSETCDLPHTIIISKQGQPEYVPFQNMVAPIKVGISKNPIQRVIVTLDQLYIFKEHEGIYRIDLTSNIEDQTTLTPILVDNTVWLAANESVQIVNDAVYFLSNRGVMRLFNNTIFDVSNDIEKELQEAVAIATKIRSFKNPVRMQYGLCLEIGGGSDTKSLDYVLQIRTGDWIKWDLNVQNSFCFPNGQLITQSNVIYNHIRIDTFSTSSYSKGEFNNPADQYDDKVILINTSVPTISAPNTWLLSTPTPLVNYRISRPSSLQYIPNIYSLTLWYYQWNKAKYYKCKYGFSADPQYAQLEFTDEVPEIADFSALNDFIYIGVNASATFHRFFAAGPDTLTKFSKWIAQFQGTLEDLSVTFDVDTSNLVFTGQVINFTTVNETAITDIPRSQARGRWITCKLTHSHPFEYLNLLGLTWVAKDLATFRIKWRN